MSKNEYEVIKIKVDAKNEEELDKLESDEIEKYNPKYNV
jgi:hypothetical protein